MNDILEIFGGKDNLVIMCDAFDIEYKGDGSVSFSVKSVRADCRTYCIKVTKAYSFVAYTEFPFPLNTHFNIEILDTLEGGIKFYLWLHPDTVKDTFCALTGLSLNF